MMKTQSLEVRVTDDYGERFDAPLIIAITFFIISAFVGAVILVASNTPSCRTTNANYCGHDSNF